MFKMIPTILALAISASTQASSIFINELHYDNAGADENEFVEIVGPVGTDLSNFSIVLYNGNNGESYSTVGLTGTLGDQDNGFGTLAVSISGIQNGSPDGVALVNGEGALLEFISYEGTFTGVGGVADGILSEDIGVEELGTTEVGFSLQLSGSGSSRSDFVWQVPALNTPDEINNDQSFIAPVPFINEIHYDNAGGDTGEFFEIAGAAGISLDGMSVELYNGNNGTVYNSVALSGTIPNLQDGFGTLAFSVSGIQNGAPDGLALIAADGVTVVEFLSYEGALTATDGTAIGLTSNDIGVAELGADPIGQSLQLSGSGSTKADFVWADSAIETPNSVNISQIFGDGTDGSDADTGEDEGDDSVEDGETSGSTSGVFLNEIHYDNDGGDVGEFLEIAGPAGTNVAGLSIVLYNGSNGSSYSTISLSGTIPNEGTGFGTLSFLESGIQNGSPDGFALVDTDGSVLEFLSYEGSLTASNGPASGLTSIDIGVSESGATAAGSSLQLGGSCSEGFSWQDELLSTAGSTNTNQLFDVDAGEICVDNGSANNGGDDGDDGAADPDAPAQAVFIHDVQGSGDSSPLDGQRVTVTGIVVADFQDGGAGTNGDFDGFYLQEETADFDTDEQTSEGIFIFDGTTNIVDVQIGDKVEVTGTATEFFEETQIGTITDVTVISTGNLGETDITPITLPTETVFVNSDGDFIADLEQYEGMWVQFAQSLTVTELFSLERFGEVGLAEGGRIFQFTQQNVPEETAYQAYLEDIAKRRVTLEDGSSSQNVAPIAFPAPGLTTSNYVRIGDETTNLEGVIRYSFDIYRLAPTSEPVFTQFDRPERPNVGGTLSVASFNVLNFFNTLDENGNTCFLGGGTGDCRGANNQVEFDRQLEKTVSALVELDADVIGLIEIENDIVEGENSSINDLVSAVNADPRARNCSVYDYVDPGVRVGSDAIAVGFMYCTDTVEIMNGDAYAILDDTNLEEIGLAELDPLFSGGGSNRAVLATTFTELATGESLTIAVNHFKSKGSGCGAGDDDTTTGQGNCNLTRIQAATALHTWLATDPTGSNDSDFLIIGDLNAYAMEDPLVELEGNGFTNVLSETDVHSFVFDGLSGTLDHGLVNDSLLTQVTGAEDWHINSDEAIALDYNTDFGTENRLAIFDGSVPFRASDHDPLIIGFALTSGSEPVVGDFDNDGDVDINDIQNLFQAISLGQDIDLSFDLNDDRLINIFDVFVIYGLCSNADCAA